MAFELTGTIIDVFAPQTFAKGFKKREFVLEYGDKYPQKIIFGLVQDKCDMLDSYGVGDTVSVSFEVKGREWTDKSGAVKYFNSLEAFRISGQQRAEVNRNQLSDEDEDDDIFASLGLSPEKVRGSQPQGSATKHTDDDLPF